MASKEESIEQVKVVEEFINKVDKYISMEILQERTSVLDKLHANQKLVSEEKRDVAIRKQEKIK